MRTFTRRKPKRGGRVRVPGKLEFGACVCADAACPLCFLSFEQEHQPTTFQSVRASLERTNKKENVQKRENKYVQRKGFLYVFQWAFLSFALFFLLFLHWRRRQSRSSGALSAAVADSNTENKRVTPLCTKQRAKKR